MKTTPMCILFGFLWLASAAPGHAFVGELDRENRFPFTVRVFTLFGEDANICTGVVVSKRLVLTAAHCIYHNSGVFADIITVQFWDQHERRDRTIRARSVWIPDDYPVKALIAEMYAIERFVFASAESDIAAIIPDDNIYNDAVLLPQAMFSEAVMDALTEPSKKDVEALWTAKDEARITRWTEEIVSGAVSPLFTVGYGAAACKNMDKNKCSYDLQRRWGEVRIDPDKYEKDASGEDFLLLHTMPTDPSIHTLFGDSGGPVVTRMGNAWVLIGIHSRSQESTNKDAAVSIAAQSKFIAGVLASPFYLEALEETGSLAVAATHSGGQVAYGIGKAAYMADAIASAMQACSQQGTSGCKVVRTARNGCLFATTGTDTSRNRSKWQTGTSREQTYRNCFNAGFACYPPKGYCLE